MDTDEKITELEVGQARLEERVDNLEGWQEKQNGSLQRLEGKMDRNQWWLIGLLGTAVLSLALIIAK